MSPPLILQTVVNNVPLDGTFTETQYGVIMVLPQVLEVRRNKCSKRVFLQVNVRTKEMKEGRMSENKESCEDE